MKPLKLALRIWITITSLLSFLAGWALLSHAPKPASIFSSQTTTTSSSSAPDPINVVPLPTLAPIPSLDSIITNPDTAVNLQPLPSFSSNNTVSNNFVPTFRTRGS